MSEGEFATSSFFTLHITHYETRQITRYSDGELVGGRIDAQLFFTGENEGVALSKTLTPTGTPVIRYYRFGCKHQMKELTPEECARLNIPHHGRSWHVHQCALCGKVDSIDSGD